MYSLELVFLIAILVALILIWLFPPKDEFGDDQREWDHDHRDAVQRKQSKEHLDRKGIKYEKDR